METFKLPFEFDDYEFKKMDGFDECIVGVVERFGCEPIICYDKNAILENLQKQGMSFAESIEYFEFNQLGSWVGDDTPCFLSMSLN